MSISGILVAVVVLLEGAYWVKLQIVKFSCGKPASNKTAFRSSGKYDAVYRYASPPLSIRLRRLLHRIVEDQCRSNSIMTIRLAASATDVDKKSEMNVQDSRCARHCAIRTRLGGI
jgi:hypothetical protein